MASRAFTPARKGAGSGSGGRAARSDWRAILRRSLRRSAELIGGALLFAMLVFLALALVSYTQTDPSGSTASGSPVENWMGLAGAWAAERVLMLFGWPGGLILPLLFIFARRLWDGTGDLIEEVEAILVSKNSRIDGNVRVKHDIKHMFDSIERGFRSGRICRNGCKRIENSKNKAVVG